MHFRTAISALILCVGLSVGEAGADAESPPRVIASIPPIHSLVASVMEGVGEPGLILNGSASPHHFSLKPSGVRQLHHADLVVWIGPAMESFLTRALRTRQSAKDTLTISTDTSVSLLPLRKASDHTQRGQKEAWDPHLWLDPDNAIVIINDVADKLVYLDPANAQKYLSNAETVKTRIRRVAATVKERLSVMELKPFIVQHDAYQYFESHFGLSSTAALTANEHISASAASVARTIETIESNNIRCVFREPQLAAGVLDGIATATGITVVKIDPLGSELVPGPGLYSELLEALSASMLDCMGNV